MAKLAKKSAPKKKSAVKKITPAKKSPGRSNKGGKRSAKTGQAWERGESVECATNEVE
jgi:hypothetical protein